MEERSTFTKNLYKSHFFWSTYLLFLHYRYTILSVEMKKWKWREVQNYLQIPQLVRKWKDSNTGLLELISEFFPISHIELLEHSCTLEINK